MAIAKNSPCASSLEHSLEAAEPAHLPDAVNRPHVIETRQCLGYENVFDVENNSPCEYGAEPTGCFHDPKPVLPHNSGRRLTPMRPAVFTAGNAGV